MPTYNTPPLPPAEPNRASRLRTVHTYTDWAVDHLSFPDNDYFQAVRHAVALSLPLLLITAIILLITLFPLDLYQAFMETTFGADWRQPLNTVLNGTIEIITMAIPLALVANLVALHNQRYPAYFVPPAVGVIFLFAAQIIMVMPQASGTVISIKFAGLHGLFSALVVAVAGAMFFLRLCRFSFLRFNLYSENYDPLLPHVFSCFLPGIFTVFLFTGLRALLSIYDIDSLNEIFYFILQIPFAYIHDSFLFGTVYTFLCQISWFFGIHGPAALAPLTQGVFDGHTAMNIAALNTHSAQPHLFTKTIFDIFVQIGGSGATIGLVLAVLIASRDQSNRRIAWISVAPGLFNINELIIFGLPIVFNPVYLIPFILTPLVLVCTSTLAVYAGLVPHPTFFVQWTTPPLINAFLATQSWRGVALQAFNLALACAIYLPFVLCAERKKITARNVAVKKLIAMTTQPGYDPKTQQCINAVGTTSALARFLAGQLEQELEQDNSNIALFFQPRVNVVDKTVPCVEALLRWNHPTCGPIPPALTLGLATESNFSHKLDACILDLVLKQQYVWRTLGITTTIAMNLSTNQLGDPDFPQYLQKQLAYYNLPPSCLLLEIKESIALNSKGMYLAAMQALKAIGVRLAVDDFGHGYQALSYLRHMPISEVQIDKGLIHRIAHDKSCQDVIGTIKELCLELDISTSAEFVESTEQLETLMELNFTTFQGHLFSRPVDAEECAAFIRDFATNPGSVPV